MTDSPRTNNMVEAWHRVFQLEVSKHPSVLKLVTMFILEQSLTELFIEQLSAGNFYKQKRCEINRTEELKAKCLKFDSNDLEDCLDQVSKVVRKNLQKKIKIMQKTQKKRSKLNEKE